MVIAIICLQGRNGGFVYFNPALSERPIKNTEKARIAAND